MRFMLLSLYFRNIRNEFHWNNGVKNRMQNNLLDDEYLDKEELSETGEKIGIEATEEDEALEPFSPDEISIQQKVVSMDLIIRRLKQGSIRLSPSFQRKEVWDKTRKSRLVESLMLNIPLPMFYVAADEKGIWEVVDGLQRLSTIRDFLIGNSKGEFLRLKNLEFLGEKYDKKNFVMIEKEDEDQKLVNSIYETEMRFTVINPGTPESVKRNIFKRINTGGMPLTSQEIRHALYEGLSSDLLTELSKSKSFQAAIGNKINDSRMGASELILRLVSFMVMDREAYKPSMDNWLSNAMRVINYFPSISSDQIKKIFQDETKVPELQLFSIDEIRNKFDCAMKRSTELFEGHAFRKSLPHESRKSPINKSLFEVWGNLLSTMTEDDYYRLVSKKSILLNKYKELLKDTNFNNSISRHSSTTKGVVDSYSAIQKLITDSLTRNETDSDY